MVNEERLREWVKDKLEDGVEPERVKKSLEETGHDPSIVDEVESPFQEDDEDAPDLSFATDEESGEDKEEIGGRDSGEEEESDSRGFSLPSLKVDFSAMPLWPAAMGGAVLLLLVFYMFVPVPSVTFSTPDFNVSAPDLSLGGSGENGKNGERDCPDVGVMIQEASVSGGRARADVLVTRGTAEVELEVYDGNDLVAESVKTVSGADTMAVEGSGNKLVFHPAGCMRYHDTYLTG